MNRDIPYDPELICDLCGKKGAFDFMGDYICPACFEEGDSDDADCVVTVIQKARGGISIEASA